MIPGEFQSYLLAQGAGSIPHSGCTLWDHLAGVHRILVACNSPDHVSIAGLFHSVYGTNAFRTVTIARDRRQEVKLLIGTKAEKLVWLFGTLDRPRLFEEGLARGRNWSKETACEDPLDANDLLRLECANLLEQKRLHSFPRLAAHAQDIGMVDKLGFSV